jgi:hypothetical protein
MCNSGNCTAEQNIIWPGAACFAVPLHKPDRNESSRSPYYGLQTPSKVIQTVRFRRACRVRLHKKSRCCYERNFQPSICRTDLLFTCLLVIITMWIVVFSVLTPCGLVGVCHHFGGTYGLSSTLMMEMMRSSEMMVTTYRIIHGIRAQKTAIHNVKHVSCAKSIFGFRFDGCMLCANGSSYAKFYVAIINASPDSVPNCFLVLTQGWRF